MKQRFLSICTALCLCLTLLPTAAWAAEGGGESGSASDKPVSGWEDLRDAIETGGDVSITLWNDVTCEAAITISKGQDLTIDLNGHTLDGAGHGSVITVKDGVTLTIQSTDSSDEGTTGTITGGSGENGGGIYIAEGGAVIMEANVEITDNTATGLGGGVYNAGTFTMKGGAIYGNSAGEAAADFYNDNEEGSEFTSSGQKGAVGTWI